MRTIWQAAARRRLVGATSPTPRAGEGPTEAFTLNSYPSRYSQVVTVSTEATVEISTVFVATFTARS